MDRGQRMQELDRLSFRIRRCRRCRLWHGRQHAVPGEGDPHARVMLIGEAPGATEDQLGRPFVGRSGRFLDQILDECALKREAVFITSSVKCRPPSNRPPRADELAMCRQAWLDRQIELVDPRLVVLLGKTPLRQLLGETTSLEGLHGQVRDMGGRRYLITYHPAAAMRFPKIRSLMLRDLRMLRDSTLPSFSTPTLNGPRETEP
jgi:uracil-DNA glycosylase